ncbi:MAG: type II secretion system F family protein [Acidobacteria bacterium]|nr:type II secretion system F family protein [Acidobacteriota bacterium]MBI3426339.1 type II secretion system F family protein [Acidobacteriota bacterium]
MINFLVFLFCLCAVYTVYLFSTRRATARRERVGERLAEALDDQVGLPPPRAQLARAVSLSELAWLDRLLKKNALAAELKRLIEQADLHLTVGRLVLFSVSATVLGMLMISMLISTTGLIVVTGLLAGAGPFLHVLYKRKQRFDKFIADLPEALEMISRALLAGQGFQSTLQLIADEMPDPIAGEFGRVYEEQTLGLSLKAALQNLMQRVPILELKMCVIAVLVQRESGGNLAEILDISAQTIRDRFRIKADLSTLTTASRMSAGVLCALPFIVVLIISWLNPTYLEPLFFDARGHRLLLIAVLLQVCGLLLVRQILRIRI